MSMDKTLKQGTSDERDQDERQRTQHDDPKTKATVSCQQPKLDSGIKANKDTSLRLFKKGGIEEW